MISKQNGTIEHNISIYVVKVSDSISARFFDAKETIAFAKNIGEAAIVTQEVVNIIWISGIAYVLGGEIRNEYIPSRKSERPVTYAEAKEQMEQNSPPQSGAVKYRIVKTDIGIHLKREVIG